MALSEKLQYLISVDAGGAIKGFESVGKAADKELGKAESRLDKVGGKMVKFGAGALAAAGVVGAGLVKAANSFEDLALEASKFSDTTGTGVEAASRLIEVASDLGIETATVESSLNKMNKTLGASPDLFKQYGVEVAKAADGTTDVNQTFLNVVARLNAIKDPAERAAVATALLGKGWTGMSELIAQGSDQLTASLAAVSDAKVISPEEAQRAKDYRAAMDQLSDSVEDLVINVGQGAAPVLASLASIVGTGVEAFGKLDAVTGGAVGSFAAFGAAGLGVVGVVSTVVGKAIQMRDSFMEMGRAGKIASVSMGAIGLALAAYQVYSSVIGAAAEKQQELEERTHEVASALVEQTRKTWELAKATSAASGEIDGLAVADQSLSETLLASGEDGDKLRRSLGALGLSAEDAATTIAAMDDDPVAALTAIYESFGLTGEQAKKFAELVNNTDINWDRMSDIAQNTYLDIGKAAGLSALQVERLFTSSEELQDQAEKIDLSATAFEYLDTAAAAGGASRKMVSAAYAIAEANGEVDDGTAVWEAFNVLLGEADQATRDAVLGTSEYQDVLSETEQAAQDAEDAVRGLRSALLASIDTGYAAADAQDQFIQAMEELAGAKDDPKTGVDELAQAQRKASQAALAMASATVANAEAIAKANGAPLTAAQSNDLMIKSLYEAALAMDANSPVRAALLGHIATLQKIPPNVTTTVTTRYLQANTRNAMEGRASGGPINAGQPYIVGEEGPELVVPSQSGVVIPAGQTERMMSGSTGGGVSLAGAAPVVNLNQTISIAGDGRGLIEAITKATKEGVSAAWMATSR